MHFPDAGFIRVSRPSESDGAQRYRIGEASRLCDGHFDGRPIVPGVALVALAMRACAEQHPSAASFRGVRDVRFTRPIGPADQLDVTIKPAADEQSVRFEIHTGGQLASSGVLIVDGDPS